MAQVSPYMVSKSYHRLSFPHGGRLLYGCHCPPCPHLASLMTPDLHLFSGRAPDNAILAFDSFASLSQWRAYLISGTGALIWCCSLLTGLVVRPSSSRAWHMSARSNTHQKKGGVRPGGCSRTSDRPALGDVRDSARCVREEERCGPPLFTRSPRPIHGAIDYCTYITCATAARLIPHRQALCNCAGTFYCVSIGSRWDCSVPLVCLQKKPARQLLLLPARMFDQH
jgi:hypothetical protein